MGGGNDLDEVAGFHVVNFDEGGLESDNIGVLQGWHQQEQFKVGSRQGM